MSVEVESPRARPLSGTLWSLLSWLRRDSSNDSLSSVGSDRTAASFAFLPPGHYHDPHPLTIPPPGPPTDTYKKRVRDRNFRRHNERDITLLRKYGLHGFDAFSLPNARRLAAGDRDRRATSELLQRVHVPGKRRAPQPPSGTNSLNRRRARKRPAPQPPLASLPEKDVDTRSNTINTLPMNSPRTPDKQTLKQSEVMGCKSEKYSKKETITKDVKPRQDKSFLKQIFESRKRNSAIETSSVKLLPSISELDKQAHEIIEKYKLKELNHNSQEGRLDNESPGTSKQTEAWICTRCLRKYNASVITCLYCLPLENALFNNSCKSSKLSDNSTQTNNQKCLEDKEKLKEILKEMKDSLPKHPAAGSSMLKNNSLNVVESKRGHPRVVEAATLRIGTDISIHANNASDEPSSPILINYTKEKTLATIENVTVTQPAVLVHTKENFVVNNEHANRKEVLDKSKQTNNVTKRGESSNLTKTQIASNILSGKISMTKEETHPTIDKVLVTQPVVLEHTKNNIVVVNKEKVSAKEASDKSKPAHLVKEEEIADVTKLVNNILMTNKISNASSDSKPSIEIPMKISSLLNPMYVPKNTTAATILIKEETVANNANENFTKPVSTNNDSNNLPLVPVPRLNQISLSTATDKPSIIAKKDEEYKQSASPKENIVIIKKTVETQKQVYKNREGQEHTGTSPGTATEVGIVEKLDQHSRRRNLINQLEQSIAKGDERAAADAAVKLAQLRLSCSVLSFSSQIVGGASTSSAETSSNNTSSSNGTPNTSNLNETLNPSQVNTENVTPPRPKESNQNLIEITNKIKNTEKKENNTQTEVQKLTNTVAAKSKEETVCNQTTSQKKDVAVQNLVRPSTSKDNNAKNNNEDVPILVWVEDKETTRGPVQIHVCRNATMGDLRRRAEQALGLAIRMQRWIIGRALCSDENMPLVSLAGPELSAPFYLCLVESETKEPNKPEDTAEPPEDAGDVYNELVRLELQSLVSNTEAFECGVCMEDCQKGSGVVLRECVHSFCNECLSDVVRHSEEPFVACPAMGCPAMLQEREIKGLVSPDEYEKWLARGLAVAESGSRHAFHCRTRDCAGWALCEPGVRRFPCPVCSRDNCVPCQAIHEGETCEQHRAKLESISNDASQTDEGTRALLAALIARGEALECPECSAIITKKWGCDWVKCSACKTEICWVTRGRRWGAGGRGDTSGGCRCGLDGKKCHPSCGYCH